MSETIRKADNRGGKREGAGRKPGRETLSVRQLREFEQAAKKMAAEYGKSLQDIVLGIAYDPDAPRKDVLAAAKLFWDKSVIAASEGGEADKNAGPAVYLPGQRPHLEAIKGGKDDEAA